MSGVLQDDNITDCKVSGSKSPRMLCACLSVCRCHLCVEAVVPDLFTGTNFYLLLGPRSSCVIVCFCVDVYAGMCVCSCDTEGVCSQ